MTKGGTWHAKRGKTIEWRLTGKETEDSSRGPRCFATIYPRERRKKRI
jgi:hypothetical protein